MECPCGKGFLELAFLFCDSDHERSGIWSPEKIGGLLFYTFPFETKSYREGEVFLDFSGFIGISVAKPFIFTVNYSIWTQTYLLDRRFLMKHLKIDHPDNDLLQLFCRQDRTAMSKIYREFFPMISQMMKKNSGNEQDAEDVFQEGLVVLLNYCNRTGFVLEVPLKSFFYAICRNIWLKKLKKKGRLEVTLVDVWEYRDLSSLLEKERESGLTSDRLLLLWKYFSRLPEHEQKTLRLYYLDGKSHKEIAQIMGFSDEVSARVQKFRYVRHLREIVRKDPDFE